MHLKIYALCAIVLMTIGHDINACILKDTEIIQENRLFFLKINNNRLGILPTETVAPGTTLSLVCNDSNIVDVRCSGIAFNAQIPVGNCDNPIKASVRPVTDVRCSADAYAVGYQVNGQFIDLYRACYDKDLVHAHFVTHNGNPYISSTPRPDQDFTTDWVINSTEANTFKTKNIYASFRAIFGPNQPYIHNDSHIIIDRGHLAPSGDFVFDSDKRATFKFINVIPQFSTINRGNWLVIENWVRWLVSTSGTAVIITGVLDEVLQLYDANNNLQAVYLDNNNNKNPIPKWLYKVYAAPVNPAVFLTYNNIFDNVRPNPPCNVVDCPLALEWLMSDQPAQGFTYCCDPTSFMSTYLPNF